ncbi:MAG: TFIIB-type zinc ribbon-containing protein [Thermoguttaceae bacterium]
MNRRFPLAAWGILFVLASEVEARKWTDSAGNEINAEYVRIHQGEVILRQGSRILKCPYDKFSEADKEYIRQQMESGQAKESRPGALTQIAGGAAPEPAADGVRELRTWQDQRGNKILAQYAGFSAGNVELLKEGGRVSYRYDAFSTADQDYVAQILVADGRGSEVPARLPPAGSEGVPSVPMGGYGHVGPPMAEWSAPPYEVSAEPAEPHYPEPPENPAMEMAQPAGESPASLAEQAMENAATEPPGMPMPALPAMGGPSHMPEMQVVWTCSACNRELPDGIDAGDKCPYCSTYLQYKEGPDGRRTNAGSLSWNNQRLVIRLGFTGFFILMAAIGALRRR